MKTNFIKFTLVAATLFSLNSCVEDTEYTTPPFPDCAENSFTKTKEVSEIPATATVAQYTGDDIIEAYVTSSDEGGNFFKSISFQTLDGSKGFSVPVDRESYFTSFEPGRKVFIKMKNMYTDAPTSGAIGMRIGDIFVSTSGTASVGRIPSSQVGQKLFASCTKVAEDDLVREMTIAEAKNDANLNTLIDLKGVQFSSAALGKTYYDPANLLGGSTNHLLTDIDGNTIIFRTGSFATFASHLVASGRGTVRGVLTKFGTDYQFIPRYERDIKLDGPRFFSFEETFSTNYSAWTKYSVTGAEAWSLSTGFGNPAPCALMNGFSGSARLNEDWLISPVLNLTGKTKVAMSFQTASRFAGNPLKVYVSSDYTGTGDPNLASWTEITGFTLDLNTASFVWTPSGRVSFDSFAGNSAVYVAFKYTSTTTAATTWEVDNVNVVAE